MSADHQPAWSRPPGDGRPPIRTIGPQRGRLLPGQQQLLDRLGPSYLVNQNQAMDWLMEPGDSPLPVVDIGVGDGASTVALATAAPDQRILAVDIHRPGLARLFRTLHADEIDNVRVYAGDVWDLLVQLPKTSLQAVQSFFPDPWPKARHHRRRLVSPMFVGRVTDVLVPGGALRLATDWAHYSEAMRANVLAENRLKLIVDPSAVDEDARWSPRFEGRPITTYERRGINAGRPPRDLHAIRIHESGNG